ncbi:uncharacterized protein LOC135845947 [Planococcus citri]|uniref:uncharacterized protein LOC135845947 n=1 Tax=Planococcus citri TaxID=170843 RepID=UPI0031F96AE9
MQFAKWCLVGLIFILFESLLCLHASDESENETTSLIAQVFLNTPIVLNNISSYSTTVPPDATPLYDGKCYDSTCPDPISSSTSPRDQRPCKCDQNCPEFRDCCADSKYYHRDEQQKPMIYECHQVDDSGYFLKRTCEASWDDAEISGKCSASATHALDIEEIELRSPVTSSVTNITYGNIYCAYCNYEFEDIILWNVSVENCGTISTIPLNSTDANFPNTTATMPDLPLDNTDINVTKKSAEYPNLTFDGKNWYYEDKSTRYSNCTLVLQPPKKNVHFQHCSTSYVIRDCPANWTDQNVADECRRAHSLVFNWHGTAYRNKYCAYCNGLTDFDLTCVSHKIFATPLGIARTSFNFNKPKQQFTVLFDFKLKIDSKICNQTKKSYHKLQSKLCPGDSEPHHHKQSKHDSWYHSALSAYTLIAVLISLIFLLLHLTIFFFVQELQTIGGKNLASFCIALILAYASFLLGNFAEHDLCYVTAVSMYYSFLSAFFWMLIISYDMWHTFWNATKKFRSPKNVEKTFIMYSILVWTMPLTLVGTTLYFDLVDSKSLLAPHFAYSGCWFDNGISLMVFFVGPVCLILIINGVLFLHTSYMLHSNRCESVNQKSRVNFKLFTRIGLLTGFTWITGFIAGYTQILIIWFLFVVLNTAQGIFIFTAFSCKKRVIRSFLKRINKFEKWQRHLDESNVKSSCTTSTPLNDTVAVNS